MANHLEDWTDHLQALNAAKNLQINYNPQTFLESKTKLGWAIDHHRGHLGFEPAGEPIAGGLFEKANQLIDAYKFADPNLVQGYFDPNAPLLGRNMVLKAHFLGFTFNFATRVNAVINEVRPNKLGHASRVCGYSYQTLQGHFEEGEMRFEIWKDLSTGEVSFHIDAYSKEASIPNLLYRLGFKVFKRPLQKHYINSALLRTRELLTHRV